MAENKPVNIGSGTDLESFIEELGGGVFKEKLSMTLSAVALAVATHGGGKKKGKVNISIEITKVNDNDQVMISHKLEHVTPTNRGDKSARDTMQTPMFVGKRGRLTIDQPKEDRHGQESIFTQGQRG